MSTKRFDVIIEASWVILVEAPSGIEAEHLAAQIAKSEIGSSPLLGAYALTLTALEKTERGNA